MMRYTIHIHCSGKGCRKLNKGNLHSFGSPHLMSASAKPRSSGMSKTIIKPEIDIRWTYRFYRKPAGPMMKQDELILTQVASVQCKCTLVSSESLTGQ
jgi:hypothetical protein